MLTKEMPNNSVEGVLAKGANYLTLMFVELGGEVQQLDNLFIFLLLTIV
ncbi:hypothetical protein ACED98_05415 [Streptococcus thoraltensis]